ncbi:Cof-type HAD-IIB family hydrolase [Caproiciproducens faecalis]|uniref:HAD family phosphatase n=1 Tax=Caproiciproducens faecalis TaxID=2820301 RepID=A0ABS7DL30_9FIRM|nr:Cof-type HAD-IIB family hydrolase [Caproiciproducens faecalis]MBW7571261.1 HAD family phosphatase [Caproiciproducens faecalis]
MIAPETMQYKMVFCDIDGTLIDSEHRVSSGTIQKIQELYHIGIPFILVSARMPSGIFPLQRELGIKAPIVCYSGALILNECGDPVRTAGIDREKAILMDSFVKRKWKQVCCSAYCHDDWIADNVHDKWILQEQSITASVPKEGRISDLVPQKGHIHKLLCMGEAGAIADLGNALKENFSGLSIYRSKDTYLEIMDGSASKSGAVKYLCKAYDIPIEATVSFGDNFNDMDMLLATGTCFAMGNAPAEVKRQARNVTADNDHEGVLAGLEQLIFAKNV